ncbi:MAG: hypothetical protein WD801_02100 [Gemmatimonadaceae bacterium]
MEHQKDAADAQLSATPPAMPAIKETDPHEPSKFKQMLAAVEDHRRRVSAALGLALLARLLFEFQFVTLLQSAPNLIVHVPYIGLVMLSYLLVLMWLAGKTRDRFGFGMALGIGVMEAAYLLVVVVMHRPFSIGAVWAPFVVAIAHIPMAVFAFQSSTAYPPLDSKKPWLVGFGTAVVFVAIPWVAPALLDIIEL